MTNKKNASPREPNNQKALATFSRTQARLQGPGWAVAMAMEGTGGFLFLVVVGVDETSNYPTFFLFT